ncbi:MAG: DUF4824 family protein [Vicinamibacterales bacterium]|nr:DUF4824 family protein [Vicinamibacterales bacterium]
MIRVVVNIIPVLMAVGWLVATGVWNRTEAVARVTLTAREAAWRPGEGTAPSRLSITWEPRADPLDARNWLTDDRLRRLGFDLSMPASAPPAGRVYGRMLPRRAWVVFELDGEAWRAIERRQALAGGDEGGGRFASRLVPIDAGPDAAELAAKYGEGRHLIIPAWIELQWRGPEAGGPLVYGAIRALDPPSITVPPGLAAHLRALAPAPAAPDRRPGVPPATPARYEVEVAVGRLGIPWIVEIR